MIVLERGRDSKPRTVELNDIEMAASMSHGQILIRGKSLVDADRLIREDYPDLDEEFYDWLSPGAKEVKENDGHTS